MRKPILMLLGCIFLYPATAAHAAVTFTDNLSELRTSALASVGMPFAFDLDGPFLREFDELGIPSSFGDTLTAFAERTDNDGTSTAEIFTSLAVDIMQSGSMVNLQMDLSYQTSQQASPGTEGFDSANAEGSVLIQLFFDLDMAYNFSFTVFDAVASGTPELQFELRQPTGGDAFDVSIVNDTQDLFFSGLLAAGNDYSLVISVDDSANLGVMNGGSATGLASFTGAELVLTPVPLPAALPLFLSGVALFGFFRRRRTREV